MVSLSSKPKDGVVGLDAPWNALPRKPMIADTTQAVYVEAVRDFLKSRGIADPKVRITRILRVDLEGDGEEEVLISATNYFTNDKLNYLPAAPFPEAPIHAPQRGSYSIVILRRIVDGNVQTKLVAGEVYAKPAESVAPNIYNLAAVLDLNGDGKLEVSRPLVLLRRQRDDHLSLRARQDRGGALGRVRSVKDRKIGGC